jgi:hypothetical protein
VTKFLNSKKWSLQTNDIPHLGGGAAWSILTPALDAAAEAFYRTWAPADYSAALIEDFPHLDNYIHRQRGNRTALREYFEGLITVSSGRRQGFSLVVLSDIQTLFDIMDGIPDGLTRTTPTSKN